MEGYPAAYASAALRFFSAWTARIHKLGYASGIYSSTNSGITDLAGQYHRCSYVLPDVIFFGHWNLEQSTLDPVLRHGKWPHHRRLHQYAGHIRQAFGGDAIDADEDYLDVHLSQLRHVTGHSLPPAPLGRGCARRRKRQHVTASIVTSGSSTDSLTSTAIDTVLATIKVVTGRPPD